jgi:nucleoside-diphosphate-sugar epimerase
MEGYRVLPGSVSSPQMDAPDLDVVVLGGAGHVGLPLSLALAAAGLRVGIFDTNAATRDVIARERSR